MATRLKRAVLTGLYRGQDALASFEERGDEWFLFVQVGKRKATHTLTRRDCKPCWTIAKQYMAELVPVKSLPPVLRKQTKKQKADAATKDHEVRRSLIPFVKPAGNNRRKVDNRGA